MSELEEKIVRLQKVIDLIDGYGRYETSFNKLYEVIKEEYQLEGGDEAEYEKGNYRHKLELVIDEEAEMYITMKKKRIKTSQNSYTDFVKRFKDAVYTELRFCKQKVSGTLS